MRVNADEATQLDVYTSYCYGYYDEHLYNDGDEHIDFLSEEVKNKLIRYINMTFPYRIKRRDIWEEVRKPVGGNLTNVDPDYFYGTVGWKVFITCEDGVYV